jgi:hypothetical protein
MRGPYVRPHNRRYNNIHRRYHDRRIHRVVQRPSKPASWNLGLQCNHAMLGDGTIMACYFSNLAKPAWDSRDFRRAPVDFADPVRLEGVWRYQLRRLDNRLHGRMGRIGFLSGLE